MPTTMAGLSFDLERYKSSREQSAWFRDRAGAATNQSKAGIICLTCRNFEKYVSTYGWNLITSSQKGRTTCKMLVQSIEHFKLLDGLLGMTQLPLLSQQQAELCKASGLYLWDSKTEDRGITCRYFYGNMLCYCMANENCVEVKIYVIPGTNATVPKLIQFYLRSINQMSSNKVQLYMKPGIITFCFVRFQF